MPPVPPLEPADDDVELPAWDLPARAIATAALVLALTGAAGGLGPTLTGVLTPFPISNTVLAAFVLVLEGPAHANAFLRGFLRGAFGFVAFCFLVAVLLLPLGTAAAFALALCAAPARSARGAPARPPGERYRGRAASDESCDRRAAAAGWAELLTGSSRPRP